jgi:hypothetical protein
MMGSPGQASEPAKAELQIDQINAADTVTATIVVRCLRGPVRLGARFHRIRGAAEAIDLELTHIVSYGRAVEQLDTAHTALVTLRGTGARHLMPGSPASGWQVIQGTNPPR